MRARRGSALSIRGRLFLQEPSLFACYNAAMKNEPARELGNKLKVELEALKSLLKELKAKRDPDAEAVEFAIVNLSSAIEILTD